MASLGEWLRQEREARNISLEEIASATKIVPRYLEALEADRLDVMPTGFFIRGIIRNYARAVGLDPENVLGRYKAAGLLSGPDRGLTSAPKPTAAPAPQIGPAPVVPAAVTPPVPVKTASPAEPEPPAVKMASSTLLFEEAAKPERSPISRKQVLAWTWRILAVLLVIAAFYFILTRHARPPQPQPKAAAITQSVLPPAQKTGPVSAPSALPSEPSSQTATQPASEPGTKPAAEPVSKPEPPPVVEPVWKGITIELTFQAETWIQVYTDGDLKVGGLFPAGATARAQADKMLLIHTGNAGGFTFLLNGKPAKPLGRSGQVLTDIKITLEDLKDFLEVPSSGLPTG